MCSFGGGGGGGEGGFNSNEHRSFETVKMPVIGDGPLVIFFLDDEPWEFEDHKF